METRARGDYSIGQSKYELNSTVLGGFPGGAVVESPPADAGHMGSCPGPGRSHMPRSGWARKPWPLSLRIWSLCSATGEATTVRGPRTTKTKIKSILSGMRIATPAFF